MLILSFDTSVRSGAVGWLKIETEKTQFEVKDFAFSFLPSIPGHAERLLDKIEMVLQSGGYSILDVDLLAIGKGPGTFTGLRIGFSTAKGLNIAHNIPIVAIPTLELVACSALAQGKVVAIMDARRNEYYMGCFEISSDERGLPMALKATEYGVMSAQNIPFFLDKVKWDKDLLFTGDATSQLPLQVLKRGQIVPFFLTGISAQILGISAARQFLLSGADNSQDLEPIYIRQPDATLPVLPFGIKQEKQKN